MVILLHVFQDVSLWEEAKKESVTAIKKIFDDSLKNTLVAVVFIGQGMKYVDHDKVVKRF